MNFIRETEEFLDTLARLQYPDYPEYSARIAEATTPVRLLPRPGDDYARVDYYLSEDGLSGYGLVQETEDDDVELVGVFSVVPGRGDEIMRDAIFRGARLLDCFDGYLPEFYKRHGFVEYHRAENWTPGGPDVVFMERKEGAH